MQTGTAQAVFGQIPGHAQVARAIEQPCAQCVVLPAIQTAGADQTGGVTRHRRCPYGANGVSKRSAAQAAADEPLRADEEVIAQPGSHHRLHHLVPPPAPLLAEELEVAGGIGEAQRVVVDVTVAVKALQVERVVDIGVGADEPCQHGVVQPPVHVGEAAVEHFVPGVALPGLVDAGVAARDQGLLAPGVVAVARHDGAGFVGDGNDAALLVAVEVAGLRGGSGVYSDAQQFANGPAAAIQGVTLLEGAAGVLGAFVVPALVDAGVEIPGGAAVGDGFVAAVFGVVEPSLDIAKLNCPARLPPLP